MEFAANINALKRDKGFYETLFLKVREEPNLCFGVARSITSKVLYAYHTNDCGEVIAHIYAPPEDFERLFDIVFTPEEITQLSQEVAP